MSTPLSRAQQRFVLHEAHRILPRHAAAAAGPGKSKALDDRVTSPHVDEAFFEFGARVLFDVFAFLDGVSDSTDPDAPKPWLGAHLAHGTSDGELLHDVWSEIEGTPEPAGASDLRDAGASGAARRDASSASAGPNEFIDRFRAAAIEKGNFATPAKKDHRLHREMREAWRQLYALGPSGRDTFKSLLRDPSPYVRNWVAAQL